MSKKTTTNNQVAWSAPPETQDTARLRDLSKQSVDYSTPIRNAYARAESNLSRSYANPLGAATTADVRDKALRSQHSDLQQSMGLDLSNAAQQNAEGQFNRAGVVAGLTRPQMYNSQSTQKVSDPLGTAMQIGQKGASMGMAFM